MNLILIIGHIRIHTGVCPYKCPHCDYVSNNSVSAELISDGFFNNYTFLISGKFTKTCIDHKQT